MVGHNDAIGHMYPFMKSSHIEKRLVGNAAQFVVMHLSVGDISEKSFSSIATTYRYEENTRIVGASMHAHPFAFRSSYCISVICHDYLRIRQTVICNVVSDDPPQSSAFQSVVVCFFSDDRGGSSLQRATVAAKTADDDGEIAGHEPLSLFVRMYGVAIHGDVRAVGEFGE